MLSKLPRITKQDLYEILSSRFKDRKKLSQIPDPALLHDGKKAAKRIALAIKNGEKIALVGDYDVDGVVSAAIMVDFFNKIPYPIKAFIPNRFSDGYGVNPTILKRIDADVIITVDNGISAHAAADICKERNIDLIITDHHTPKEKLPDAYAIVNPKLKNCNYPFKEICGAQVAWLFLGLLKKELGLTVVMREFLDILAIAIIADIMPLIDINRTIVQEGLKVLMQTKRPASVIIRDFLNKSNPSSEDIAFMIAPRINSAGRMQDASVALEFFTAKEIGSAYKKFELLCEFNELRKTKEAQTTKEAIAHVKQEEKIIVVADKEWHEGVVGIVASRLVDRFEKPAIVLSIKESEAKGSARSIGDISIYELIKENEHLLTKFGGHKMAAGLSLETKSVNAFREAINISAKRYNKEQFLPQENLIGILNSEDIDNELLNILESFEPYGEANARPLFLLYEAEIVNITLIGADKSHSKIEVRQYPNQKKNIELIAFRTLFKMPDNRKITCSYSVAKNEFNGRVSPQLLIKKIYNGLN